MNIILRLSGTFGSGKTTAVREFLDPFKYSSETLRNSSTNKVMGYKVNLSSQNISTPLYIVGSYENICGGTDGIKTQEEVGQRILKAWEFGHVIYEGALVSGAGLKGTVTQMTESTEATTYAFLDTSEDKCIERVIKLDAGNIKEFNPKNLIHKYRSVFKCSQNLDSANYNVISINHLNPHPQLLELIRDAENDRR